MSTSFNLGLPTDIPWERLCFTDDMVHTPICGTPPPPAWRSSMAIFKYEPQAEYQTLANYTISYLKVSVTITPDAPDIPVDYIQKFVKKSFQGKVNPAAACYGALLQVSVAPKGGGTANQIYFADFEPKKRELYEAVTDTKQISSGSASKLSVGKSAVTTEGTESYNKHSAGIDFTIPIPGVGEVDLSGGIEGGTTNRSSLERSDVTTTDRSTERRELQSHTTEIAQMYNLFQAFHVGTNRAVFFMEPRPHIVQGEATFINGPRALEGIQEIFLVVVRPKSMPDFCVNASLQTAHLDIRATYFNEPDVDIAVFYKEAPVPDDDDIDEDEGEYISDRAVYTPPPGMMIDVEATRAESVNIVEDKPGRGSKPGKAKIESVTADKLVLYGEVSWGTYDQGGWTETDPGKTTGILKFNVTVHLKPKKIAVREYLDRMYINVRNLCCCPAAAPDRRGPCDKHWDYVNPTFPGETPEVFVKWPTTDLSQQLGQREVYRGPATKESLVESAEIATFMRDQLINSTGFPEGHDPCAAPYSHSDVFFSRVTDTLQNEKVVPELDKFIHATPVIPPAERDLLVQSLGNVTLATLLRSNSSQLADIMGKSLQETLLMKEQILLAVTPTAPNTIAQPPLRGVTSVKIGTTYPDPNNPRILAEMTDPRSLMLVNKDDQPNYIDISFGDRPDEGTLLAGSISIEQGGISLATQQVLVNSTTVRVISPAAFNTGDPFKVTVRGNGVNGIKFGGLRLDGEPLGLPSGDGIEGGDFIFMMRVVPPAPTSKVMDTVLLKALHVRISSTNPDPANPRLLSTVHNPREMAVVAHAEQPDHILIGFNEQPDAATVSTSTFRVTRDGATVNTTVTANPDKSVVIKITDPIVANGIYTVTISGKNEPTVKYSGRPLDGEPYGLPSGDGIGGGDFTFVMKAYAPVAVPPPVIPATTLRVLGVRILSSVPSTRLLSTMIHPGVPQLVTPEDTPDLIEVEFNDIPDGGTVTTSSFTIGQGSVNLSAAVLAISPRVYRLKVSTPLVAGETYTVKVLGTGGSPVKRGGAPLDGEPLSLPSGDGAAGGDFTFDVTVSPATVVESPLPLLKVVGARVLSSVPDPAHPRVLAVLTDPSEMPILLTTDQPNLIDIDFNLAPDPGMVTPVSFLIEEGSTMVAHTTAMVGSTTARLTITDTLVAGKTYKITMRGDLPNAVVYQGRRLDGEPDAFPSGNGTEGGNFFFSIKLAATP